MSGSVGGQCPPRFRRRLVSMGHVECPRPPRLTSFNFIRPGGYVCKCFSPPHVYGLRTPTPAFTSASGIVRCMVFVPRGDSRSISYHIHNCLTPAWCAVTLERNLTRLNFRYSLPTRARAEGQPSISRLRWPRKVQRPTSPLMDPCQTAVPPALRPNVNHPCSHCVAWRTAAAL